MRKNVFKQLWIMGLLPGKFVPYKSFWYFRECERELLMYEQSGISFLEFVADVIKNLNDLSFFSVEESRELLDAFSDSIRGCRPYLFYSSNNDGAMRVCFPQYSFDCFESDELKTFEEKEADFRENLQVSINSGDSQ